MAWLYGPAMNNRRYKGGLKPCRTPRNQYRYPYGLPFMSEIRDELDPPFEVLEPKAWRGPVLFNSPHSGSVYPRDFLATCRLDIAALRRSEDSFVDELIAGVVSAAIR